MESKSYAKVNLYLRVGRKLKNGYHQVQSLMQLVKLHDNLSFERLKEDKIVIESNNKDLENKKNLAYKAAELLKRKYKVEEGVRIRIEKNIPLASGLGGGSSNAAATLTALNRLWKLRLKENQLIKPASGIGSDVPFFIKGKAATVEGVGEKVKPLKKSISINVVLVNPGIKVSTTWAYKQLDKAKKQNSKSINELSKGITGKNMKKIVENMHNDFDPIVEKKHKIVKNIKQNLKKFDAESSMVVGSGPTVIGIYDSIYTAREAYFKLKDLYPFVYLTKTF